MYLFLLIYLLVGIPVKMRTYFLIKVQHAQEW